MAYTSFEQLEATVPLSQLRPSVAFTRCAAHLPHDVDQLHGDELVQSLANALAIHSKARVVLQCWVLLIMRRRLDAPHEKDALYSRLQQTAVSPQEKIRYRRGAMLLCHLLVEREGDEGGSLLDRYLVDYYFPWSSAVNDRDDTFYMQADVVHWVRQALDYLKQDGSKMTAVRWLELSRPSPSPSSATSAPVPTVSDQRARPSTAIEPTTVTTSRAQRTRSQDSYNTSPPHTATAQHWSPPALARKKRRRIAVRGAHRELTTLKEAIGRWAKRLRRQLLQAASCDDKERIREIADELQAPPLVSEASDSVAEHTDESESGDDRDSQRAEECSSDDDSSDNLSQEEQPQQTMDECSVCEAEPKRREEVWNASCRHGFCGDCMLARLSQRERRCMYCRANIAQVVDGSGKMFQHHEWTKLWREQRQAGQGVGMDHV